jgi:hypothetical protein
MVYGYNNKVCLGGFLLGDVSNDGKIININGVGKFELIDSLNSNSKLRLGKEYKLSNNHNNVFANNFGNLIFYPDGTATFGESQYNKATYTLIGDDRLYVRWALCHFEFAISDDGTGIVFGDAVFTLADNSCSHSSTKVKNSNAIYTGDVVCSRCGYLVDLGDYTYTNGTYIVKSKGNVPGNYFDCETVYTNGGFPSSPSVGDVYIYNNVEYRYGYYYDGCDGVGWIRDNNARWTFVKLGTTTDMFVLKTINGNQVELGRYTFWGGRPSDSIKYEEGWKNINISEIVSHTKYVYLPASTETLTASYNPEHGQSRAITDIYFAGTEEQWNNITIGETKLFDEITVHFNCNY